MQHSRYILLAVVAVSSLAFVSTHLISYPHRLVRDKQCLAPREVPLAPTRLPFPTQSRWASATFAETKLQAFLMLSSAVVSTRLALLRPAC